MRETLVRLMNVAAGIIEIGRDKIRSIETSANGRWMPGMMRRW